ncbi:MAG: hypothetical protein KYX62_16445 [Pseudomonadota bacterium]|nr:hypothetical protein [Pseudomonadota bacterium]
MDELIHLLVIVPLLFLFVAILGVVGFVKAGGLKRRVWLLEKRLRELEGSGRSVAEAPPVVAAAGGHR